LFLEPEGLDNDEYYINGFATSLPEDVQLAALRTIPALESVQVNRFGYAVEYDAFPAEQLHSSLECKRVPNLYLAGQTNGTSGYEEAAAQGFLAGVNAARSLEGKHPIVLGRDQAYMGVLVDDLITKVPEEPYRMFTSRAEFRLLLRQDNARHRLREIAREIGLHSDDYFDEIEASNRIKAEILQGLSTTKLRYDGVRKSAALLLKRPEIALKTLMEDDEFGHDFRSLVQKHPESAFHAELEIKYDGYLARQQAQVEAFRKMENFRIPDGFEYDSVQALSAEARAVLGKVQPLTLGQASRIPGVRVADLFVLMVLLRRR
jgi:tRNA uridine 5-carboxymethylaminomethyl modification enzyme